MTTKQDHQVITGSTGPIGLSHLTEDQLLAQAISMSLNAPHALQQDNKESEKNNKNKDDELTDDQILAQAISISLNGSGSVKKDKEKQIEAKEQKDNNLFLDHLWGLAEENIFPLLYSRCKADVVIKISGKDMHCLIDTGAQMNCLTIDIVKKYGLESFMDPRYKGKAVGVGSSNILGMIPYIEIKFGKITCAVNFTVLDNKGSSDALSCAILGLPFIMFYKIKLDFEKSKLTIMGHDINMQIKEQR